MTIAERRAPTLADTLDFEHYEYIAELAELGASYWRGIAEAARRGERLTLEIHCRQVAAVTREAFGVVKTLGADPDAGRTA